MALLSARYQNDGIPVLELDEIQNKYISEYTDKIKDGRYRYISAPCECGSEDLEVIAEKEGVEFLGWRDVTGSRLQPSYAETVVLS